MNPTDLAAFISYLQNNSALARVNQAELTEAIEKAVAAGWSISAPAA